MKFVLSEAPERRLCGKAALHGTKCLLLEDAEDFFFAHDQQLFAVQLDLGARVLAEEDVIAGLDVERERLAFVVRLALAHGDDFALLWLLFCGVRDDDAATNALAFFNPPNQNPVMQRCKRCCRHCYTSPWCDLANGGPFAVAICGHC